MSEKTSLSPEELKILEQAYLKMIEKIEEPAKVSKLAIIRIGFSPILGGYPTADLQGYGHEYSYLLMMYEFFDELLR